MAKPDYASERSSRKNKDVESDGQSYYPGEPPADGVPCPPLIIPARISANNEELRQVAQVILQETAKLRKRKILSTIFVIVFVISVVIIVILLVVRQQRPRQYKDK